MQYFVCNNIEHNGKSYVRGVWVELSDAEAAPLLDIKVIQTEAVEEPAPLAAPVVEEVPAEASVGGQQAKTGEDSIDGTNGAEGDTAAEEVGPGIFGGFFSKHETTEQDPSANL